MRRRLLGISAEETTFARRGFRGSPGPARDRLERIGRVFVDGYHAGLEAIDLPALTRRLEQVDREFRGFAYEGAAMALAMLDRLTPWNRRRIRNFLEGSGAAHAYMVHVAIGWVVGRLGGSLEKRKASLDPLLRWLVVEGYGFHEGFFHWPRYLGDRPRPRRVGGYAERVFDQGLGRSLWFIEGADVQRLPITIEAFPVERHGDLWSGVGLGCTYAGEVEEEALRFLREAAGTHRPSLAQGAAFAAKARQRAGNLVPYTDLACQVLCGRNATEAAQVTDDALENLPVNGPLPSFEIWRRRIQSTLNPRSIQPTP